MSDTSVDPANGGAGEDSASSPTAIFATALVGAAVGIISVLAFDFGGWYERVAFGSTPIQRWHYIGLLENPVQFIVFAAIAVALGYSAYVSITALRRKAYPQRSMLRNSVLLSGTATAVLLVIALIFAVATLPDEPEDWWLDTGFYGGFVGSAVATAMFWMALRNSAPHQVRPVEPDTER